MTTAQARVNSGFGMRSTADEVLEGIDLTGQLAIVTGGASGIGLETTRALNKAGAQVIAAVRRVDAAREALNGLNVEIAELDLADLQSVKRFAQTFLASGRSIDMLINNAGVMAMPETRVGPGWEAQFATNHLGHYALTNLLWPALFKRGARVVEVSSMGHQSSPIRFDDLMFTKDRYSKWKAYGQSKTANSLFAVQLDKLGQSKNVRAFSLHPGGIITPLQRHIPKEEQIKMGWIDEHGAVTNPAFKTPEQGAATSVWCATSPKLAGKGGVYCEDCEVAEVTPDGQPIELKSGGLRQHAVDPAAAEKLWQVSAELTGIDAFAAAR